MTQGDGAKRTEDDLIGKGDSRMSIPCLRIQWPTALEETGPPEDPTIMLLGSAHMGTTPFKVLAIRVNARLKFMPDYRPDLPEAVYESGKLEVLLAELGEIAATDHPGTIALETGSYVMWMAPASEPPGEMS